MEPTSEDPSRRQTAPTTVVFRRVVFHSIESGAALKLSNGPFPKQK